MSKKKKNFLFLFTHYFLPHCIFSLTLSIFLFSFTFSHSRSSLRLHLVLTTLWDFSSFSPLPKWPNGVYLYFFIFSSFLPFTLFSSNHNKCKPLTLTLLQSNFFSSALPCPNDRAFYFFLFFLPSACWTRLSQPTQLLMQIFVHNEEKIRNIKDKLIK